MHPADVEGRPLQIVVMGTGPFAVPMFRALLASGHTILALVTRPDRAAPGRRAPPNPMRAVAEEAGLPVLAPERVNDAEAVAGIRSLAPDLLVVCDYGQILSPELLGVPPLGGINLHGSLLPRHRGAAPVQWAILAGDAESGACVIHMTPTLDGGGVIVAEATPIGAGESASQLEARLAAFGPRLVLAAIEALTRPGRAAGPCGVPQDPALVTKAPRFTKADGLVDWSKPAAWIARMPRALDPWPRAASFLHASAEAKPVRLVLEEVDVGEAAPAGTLPGAILAADEHGLVVACGDGGTVRVARVVPEGRSSMSVADFLRGRHVGTAASMGPA